MLKIRASALSNIMTEPKGKEEILSKGAITYCNQIAREFVYNFNTILSSKYCEKGVAVEQQSINLYNSVFFTNYEKNTERKANEWLTGECDIFTGDKIIDIKSSWNLNTFPTTPDEGMEKAYEWQLRAYMMLWNVDQAELAYCLVNTPDELIKYEQEDLHFVDHIPEQMRVTTLQFERDIALEEKIKEKCEAAFQQIQKQVNLIKTTHGVV